MMRPWRALSMLRLTARVQRKTPVRFRSSTWRQSCVFIRISKPSRVMPALLTSTSSRASRASTVFTIASVCSSSATSARTLQARPPAAVISATTDSAASGELE